MKNPTSRAGRVTMIMLNGLGILAFVLLVLSIFAYAARDTQSPFAGFFILVWPFLIWYLVHWIIGMLSND